jgi:hypothetical protein
MEWHSTQLQTWSKFEIDRAEQPSHRNNATFDRRIMLQVTDRLIKSWFHEVDSINLPYTAINRIKT